jgi:ABC-type protease/lipase transport system fused ATPase/permease subunit
MLLQILHTLTATHVHFSRLLRDRCNLLTHVVCAAAASAVFGSLRNLVSCLWNYLCVLCVEKILLAAQLTLGMRLLLLGDAVTAWKHTKRTDKGEIWSVESNIHKQQARMYSEKARSQGMPRELVHVWVNSSHHNHHSSAAVSALYQSAGCFSQLPLFGHIAAEKHSGNMWYIVETCRQAKITTWLYGRPKSVYGP